MGISMNTVELFAGTKSFSKVMKSKGFTTITYDNNKDLNPTYVVDILKKECMIIPIETYLLWASPPCTGFSVASIGKAWNKDKTPKSETAKIGLRLLEETIILILKIKPKYWFIENPRGMMRVVIDDLFKKYGITNYRRVTVTYCQYGDTRIKPTDIWTNLSEWEGKKCKNGDKCHVSAPRGSRTGTQGLKDAKERGVIPPALFEEILNYIKEDS